MSIDSLLAIAKTTNNDSIKIKKYHDVANLFIRAGDLLSADSITEVMLKVAVLRNNIKGKTFYFFDKGYIHELQGNYVKAIEYYLKALKLAEGNSQYNLIASIYNNLGIIYFNQGDLDKALEQYLKAVKLAELQSAVKGLGDFYNNAGNVYYRKKNYDIALAFYTKSLNYGKEKGRNYGISQSLNNIGSVYLMLNQNDKAMSYFIEAEKIHELTGDKYNLAYSFLNQGAIYVKKANYNAAQKFILKGLNLAKELNYPDVLRDAYSDLSDLYASKNEAELAIKYYKLYVSYKDSLENDGRLKEITQKEMRYEFSKKELVLRLENEKQTIENREEKMRNKIIVYSILFGLLLIIIFAILIYNRYKLTQYQKKTIEEKNKELTDSINYAKRLQGAILIPETELQKHFADAFILFKPKDIVSGDFYWFSESDQNNIIAVADCTGHGVPGAFMSMLGYESLQDVVLRENITTTSQALKSLDKKITDTLNKSSRSFRDGMDIALCAFNKKENTLQYSGANRPLFQISEGKLIEHKPDKNTIGGDIDNADKKYNTKIIEYKIGDIFYMFTDGYADQFGGPQGKKFMVKQLKELLVSVSTLSMQEQKQKIDASVIQWQGSIEQVDDICLIGIKV